MLHRVLLLAAQVLVGSSLTLPINLLAAESVAVSACVAAEPDAIEQPVPLTQLQLALDNGDIGQAQNWFRQWPESDQVSPAGQIIAARLLAASDSKAASRQLKALAGQFPENADILQQLGAVSIDRAQRASMFSALGHAKDALEYWQQAVQIDPQHQRSLQSLAMYYLAAPGIAGGDKDEVEALAARLLTLDAPAALILQAQVLRARDHHDEAMQLMNAALVQHSQAANLYFVRARWHADDERWQSALEDFLRACQHADDAYLRRSVQYQLGRLAVLAEQHIDAGIEALQAVRAADDVRYQGWTELRLAKLYILQGKLDQAGEMLGLIDTDAADKNLRKQRKAVARELSDALAQQTEQEDKAGLQTAE